MAAVDPGAYGPPPHLLNTNLIELLHHGVREHRSHQLKADWGKMLAQALMAQAREHSAAQAAGNASSGGPGGQVADQGPPAATPPTWAGGHSSVEQPTGAISPLVEAAAAALAHNLGGGGGGGFMEHVNMLGGQGHGSPAAAAAAGALQRTSLGFHPYGIGGY